MTKEDAYSCAQAKLVQAASILTEVRNILEPYSDDEDTYQALALVSPSSVLRPIQYMRSPRSDN